MDTGNCAPYRDGMTSTHRSARAHRTLFVLSGVAVLGTIALVSGCSSTSTSTAPSASGAATSAPSSSSAPSATSSASREAMVGTRNVRMCFSSDPNLNSTVLLGPAKGTKGHEATLVGGSTAEACYASNNKSFLGNAAVWVKYPASTYTVTGENVMLQRPDLFLCSVSASTQLGDAYCDGAALDAATLSIGKTLSLRHSGHLLRATRLPDTDENIEFSIVVVS